MPVKPQQDRVTNRVVNHVLGSSGKPPFPDDSDHVDIFTMEFRKLEIDDGESSPETLDGRKSPRLPQAGHLTIDTSHRKTYRELEVESFDDSDVPSTPLVRSKGKARLDPGHSNTGLKDMSSKLSNKQSLDGGRSRPEMGKPALIRVLASFCYDNIPEAILHQLASILDGTPANTELTSTLRDVIPLVIGEYIKPSTKMDELLDELEAIIRSKRLPLEKSSRHVGQDRRGLVNREEYHSTSAMDQPQREEEPNLDTVYNSSPRDHRPSQHENRSTHNPRTSASHVGAMMDVSPTDNSGRRVRIPSQPVTTSPHSRYDHQRRESGTNHGLQGHADNFRETDDRDPPYEMFDSSSVNRHPLDGQTNQRVQRSVPPESRPEISSRQNPASQSTDHLRSGKETQRQRSQIGDRRTYESPSRDALHPGGDRGRRGDNLNHDSRSHTPQVFDDYDDDVGPLQTPHSNIDKFNTHRRQRDSEVPTLAGAGNSLRGASQEVHHHGYPQNSSDVRHGRAPGEGIHDHQSSANVYGQHRHSSPYSIPPPDPGHSSSPSQPRESFSERNQRTPHFESHTTERHPERPSTGAEGGKTVEYEPILKLLKLTCHNNAKEQALEHYVHTVTHSPIRAQADRLALELDVTLATQNCLAADLLVPVKPFVKHIVDILLHRGQLELTRSKEIEIIQQELAAACSGTPYQVVQAAATLVSHIPNDEDLSSTIQAVILGMLSGHILISREILVEKIAQLRRLPDSVSSQQRGPSSGSAHLKHQSVSSSSRLRKDSAPSEATTTREPPAHSSQATSAQDQDVSTLLDAHKHPRFARKRIEGAARVAANLCLRDGLIVYRKERDIKAVTTHLTVWYLSAAEYSLDDPPLSSPLPGDIYLHFNTKTKDVQVWVYYEDPAIRWEDVTESYFSRLGDIIHPEIEPTRYLGVRGVTNEPTWLLDGSFKRKAK